MHQNTTFALAGPYRSRKGTITCLVVKRGYKFAHVVQMRSGQLKLRKEKLEDFDQRWEVIQHYPLAQALELYLHHPGGHATSVKRILTEMSHVAQ
ncbi:hypothetical protein [Cupriavidus sp. RAF12]|uniref:hypothetical protein n=1 Tax=Cupriavidus sp. RAF12 TaxID=3233050 RepID=UPI003F8E2326